MHPLTKLTVERFRGLRDLALEGLGRVNLLVGRNNSGKTSVLEAIFLYCNPLDEFAWIQTAQRRELGDSRRPRSEVLAWLFPHAQDDNPTSLPDIRLTGEGRHLDGRIEVSCKLLEGIAMELQQELQFPPLLRDSIRRWTEPNEIVKGIDLDIDVSVSTGKGHELYFTVWDPLPVKRARKMPSLSLPVDVVTPMSHRLARSQVQHLTQATIAGFKDDVLSLLRHLDPDVLDIDVLDPAGNSSSVYIHHKTVGRAPLSTFGSGLQRALLYSLAIPGVRGGVLLIDELESAIHVSALPEIFGWLVQACEQHDIQLFATTHSLEAVDAVLGASQQHLDRIVGFRLNPPGSRTNVTRFDGELLHGIRHERGLDVR